MEAWVIKRDDGKYLKGIRWINNECCYVVDVFDSIVRRPNKQQIQNIIMNNKLKNCKPVKIKICEVEEDEIF